MPPIAGAVGGILALVGGGFVYHFVRQRRLRREARARIKASSRRFMESSQDSAYGNTHKDGSVNLGAASARESRRNETTVMFQVQLPQGSNLPAQSRPSGARRPARANSMAKKGFAPGAV